MKDLELFKRVEWISILHKQNLNGRETEDELFEAGILAGIEETEEIMYSEKDVLDILIKFNDNLTKPLYPIYLLKDWFNQNKKKVK